MMSRLLGKFVQDSTITDLQIRLRNGLPLRSRNSSDTADISLLQVGITDVLEILREMSMESNKITNLADGTAASDAVNLGQIQSLISGLKDPKDASKAATTGALPASTYDNGTDGTGATLTADANGSFPSQDGIALSVGDNLLVKNQVNQTENGLYNLTQAGDAGTPWILTRSDNASIGGGDAVDQPNSEQVTQGMNVPVAEGTENGGIAFIMTTVDPISLGSSNLNFIRLGENIVAGQGLNKTGSTLSVDNGDGLGFSGNSLVVLVDNDLVDGTVKIDSSGNVAGRKRDEQEFTLNATDISNGYVDLSVVASRDSVLLFPRFGIKQKEVADFTVSYTGGASGKTRVSFAGDLASIISSGDVIDVNVETLDF
jgi:hypothetical protein